MVDESPRWVARWYVVHREVGGAFAIEVGGAFLECGDEGARIESALGMDPIVKAGDRIDDVTRLVEYRVALKAVYEVWRDLVETGDSGRGG